MKQWKIFLLTLLSSSVSLPLSAQPQEVDGVVAIVNDGVILKSDVAKTFTNVQLNARRRNQQLPPPDQLQEQIINKLIVDKIQLQEAERLGIQINDDRVDQTVAQIAAESRMDTATFAKALNSVGVQFGDFREQIRQEIAIKEARNTLVRRRINISPSEVDALAEKIKAQNFSDVEYKMSQIQINIDENKTKQQAEEEAKQIVSRLQAGEDFATIAYASSNDSKALQGGDWGWMRVEEMPTIFAEKIGLNSKGSIIGPFTSGAGVHILRIDDVRGAQRVTVTEVNAQHILIKPSIILSDNGARQQLYQYIEQINSGQKTFDELAKENSQDVGSAINNGVLGYAMSNVYVPEFKARVDHLPVGQISEPFKTQHGWHIVKVLDRRVVDKTEDAIKDQAYQMLMNRKFNDEASVWLQEMRGSAYIEIKDKG